VPGASILVVEDDQEIRDFLALVLEGEGYAVRTAPNGAVALELIGEAPPQLILLDMRMPVMDGWAFARAYRGRPGPHAPILVMTAARDAAERAQEIEADGYVAKPFDLDHLLSLVRRFTAPGEPPILCAA
jgi:CheY-like chemotaxis protein